MKERVHGQLALPIQLPAGRDWQSFVVGPNEAAVAAMRALPDSAVGGGVYVTGARGLGKSHLLQATVRELLEMGRQALYVPLDAEVMAPDALQGLEEADLVALDGLERIGSTAWEEAIFHLYNRAQLTSAVLVFAARTSPRGLGLQLPDLISRLQAATLYRLQPLGDTDLVHLLGIHASRRGLVLPEAVGRYLSQRLPREGHSLVAALDRLDRAALAAQRSLTIPFAREVLGLKRTG